MSKQSLGRVSLVPKGAYSALTAYKRMDVVTYDGASYIVLRPVQGVTPVDGEDYMLLVQDGDTPDLSVGTVETLAAGSEATASIGGTPDKPVLNFGIPKGDTGAAPVLKMGKVTTLEPGSEASASLSGTAEEPEMNLNIPRGASGGVDVASASIGQTIIVKAVDENGKPIEWEAADMASGSVKKWKKLGEFEFTSEDTLMEMIFTDLGGMTSFLFVGNQLVCEAAQTSGMNVKINGLEDAVAKVQVVKVQQAARYNYATLDFDGIRWKYRRSNDAMAADNFAITGDQTFYGIIFGDAPADTLEIIQHHTYRAIGGTLIVYGGK